MCLTTESSAPTPVESARPPAKKAPKPPKTPPKSPAVSQGEAFFANKTDVAAVEDELPKVTTKTTKEAPKKKAKKKAAPAKKKAPAAKKKSAPATASSNDWSGFTDSTLKRKTIKQLSDYLESKGLATTDASGEPLKKAELVEAVKAS